MLRTLAGIHAVCKGREPCLKINVDWRHTVWILDTSPHGAAWGNRMLADTEIKEVAPEVPHAEMTDAELVAVIVHDSDALLRRRALHVLRLREFKAGAMYAIDSMTKVPK